MLDRVNLAYTILQTDKFHEQPIVEASKATYQELYNLIMSWFAKKNKLNKVMYLSLVNK
jgi:hypothetical protein